MAEGQELLRIWSRRIWRRRWPCLGVTWAACALGWSGVSLLGGQLATVAAGLLLAVVLVAGAAAGVLFAVLIERRAPVFDSVAELQRAFDRPVLGSVADLSAGAWPRAITPISFALGCGGLIALGAALLVLRAPG